MNRAWVQGVRSEVDRTLHNFFAEKRKTAARYTPHAEALVNRIAHFTLDGGKRLRPVVLFAGYRATSKCEDIPCLLKAAAALELLQSYLLIHDDWMDEDELRRGKPALHAALRDELNNEHLGASLAVLAGDLASTYAWELLTSIEIEQRSYRRALSLFHQMQEEVVFGQQLDLLRADNLQLLQDLKTGSYTVRGPLCLGAMLAHASEDELAGLRDFAQPLGEAFQLRDDILGVFGNVQRQGKPAGNDLRAGKHTLIVDNARECLIGSEKDLFNEVFGQLQIDQSRVQELIEILELRGVKARSEERLASLNQKAKTALDDSRLKNVDKHWLEELISILTRRED